MRQRKKSMTEEKMSEPIHDVEELKRNSPPETRPQTSELLDIFGPFHLALNVARHLNAPIYSHREPKSAT
jgi:hypothetical protein